MAAKTPFICNSALFLMQKESERNVHHSEEGLHSAATGTAKARIAPRCADSQCNSQSIVVLAGLGLCLDHFLAKCYERLDRIEPLVRSPRIDPQEVHGLRKLLQECANQTLLVCLRHEPLSNLERSRLLEILLQCGDLQVLLHRPIPHLV